MSISPIGSQNVWSLPSSSQTSNWQNVLNAASSALGLSTSDLQSQLANGNSLSSIAQTQGVSQDTLIQSITSALKQNGQLSGASGSQLQQIATSIANRTPGARGHHHHHGHGAGSATESDTLLSALDGDSSTDGSASSDGSTSSGGSTSSDGSTTSQGFDLLA